ncbi:MAG: aminotransferase class I/II-fold pyridoxal phosphate-dependent enzyme [Rickettsiales bacterium]|jgi:O-succinylhomoserine sulfhydrylase|nr:aminotransferase class I/II-fold pyridoxal phosphate-dependent enzyme [Rickettsiales bacterium]
MTNYKNKKLDNDNLKLETKLIRGDTLRTNFGETSEALFLNSGFCYNDAETAESRFNGDDPGYVYSRYVNPTLKLLEDRLLLLESGAESACVMASGMAAVFASIMCQAKAGDHIIANKVLFGSCYHIITQILPNYNISYTLVDGSDVNNFAKAIQDNTTLAFIETPSNPTLDLVDIEGLAKICKASKVKLIVDNIFATNLMQKPLDLGADIVIYSTTKHIDGQGRSLGGAVLGKTEFIQEQLLPFHRHTGPALSPFNAWCVTKSLETFTLRVEKQCENAHKLAEFLESHPKTAKVIYPYLKSHPQYELAKKQMLSGGSMIAFEVSGGKAAAFSFMNKLTLTDISNNLGDAKSLITHPGTTTHSNIEGDERVKLGITDGLMRLSVGLEHIDDLINDINNALR